MRTRYVVQRADKSFCPKCGAKLDLLTPEMAERLPMFYICRNVVDTKPCDYIGQAGVGPVRREGE